MDASSWRKLKDFVYNKKGKMAEAYDEITEMFTYVDHTNATTFTMWLEDVLQMDRSYLKLVGLDGRRLDWRGGFLVRLIRHIDTSAIMFMMWLEDALQIDRSYLKLVSLDVRRFGIDIDIDISATSFNMRLDYWKMCCRLIDLIGKL